MIAKLLYNLGIHLYHTAIRIAAPFNPKAALWLKGRKNWRGKIKEQLSKINGRPVVWVHCASLGEFEQGRPIIEAIKQQYPQYAIVLSFFSPSGYEVRKDYDKADIICYLPLDTKANARDFLQLIDPQIAIFIKYEFWLNFLDALKEQQVDAYIVSAVFKEHQPFFKWYGRIFRDSLKAFKTLFVQDNSSLQLLKQIGINNTMVCGDTRFDRVMEIKDKLTPLPEIARFKGTGKLIIAGSTWPRDEDLALAAYKELKEQDVKLVLVPHDIEETLLKATTAKLDRYGMSYSLYTKGIDNNAQVLVLDTIGMLSRIYFYADVTYIGGGFNGGLHNCLEAAVYGLPVTFADSNYAKYNEATDLVNIGAAVNVSSGNELYKIWQTYLTDEILVKAISAKTEDYFRQNAHATQKILAEISFK